MELNICVKTDQFHLVSVSITLLQSCQALPKSIRRVSLGPLVSRCVSHVPYISHFFCVFQKLSHMVRPFLALTRCVGGVFLSEIETETFRFEISFKKPELYLYFFLIKWC